VLQRYRAIGSSIGEGVSADRGFLSLYSLWLIPPPPAQSVSTKAPKEVFLMNERRSVFCLKKELDMAACFE
jgi:hypothetical protein